MSAADTAGDPTDGVTPEPYTWVYEPATGGSDEPRSMLPNASAAIADGHEPSSPAGFHAGGGAGLAVVEGGLALRIRRRTTVEDLAALLAAAAGTWRPGAATVRPVEMVFAPGGGPLPAESGDDIAAELRNLGEEIFTSSYYLHVPKRLAEALGTVRMHAERVARMAGHPTGEVGDPASPDKIANLAGYIHDIAMEVDVAKTLLRGGPQPGRDIALPLDDLATRLRQISDELAGVASALAEIDPDEHPHASIHSSVTGTDG